MYIGHSDATLTRAGCRERSSTAVCTAVAADVATGVIVVVVTASATDVAADVNVAVAAASATIAAAATTASY